VVVHIRAHARMRVTRDAPIALNRGFRERFPPSPSPLPPSDRGRGNLGLLFQGAGRVRVLLLLPALMAAIIMIGIFMAVRNNARL
jgi:hypothetical protein